ncbi:hypothetical protein NG798_15845 [Ancylothrix sp. C2]|uniref:hypothetical protein n=1 Tax=Ancylothrix sp. D3o TaxID=2953691 RepID=UPI0021BB7006|nr:hypothetical protein [Ancylothrix sp. D3o]MCT7951273.1 hypothetical protein [Ancylothrix sp. D3o]
MRTQVSGLLRLGKGPVRRVALKKPKSQLSWWKRYDRLDFWVNGSGSENNRKPNQAGFSGEQILTPTGLEAGIVEPIEEEEKLEVFEIPEEDEPENENEMRFVAGWV